MGKADHMPERWDSVGRDADFEEGAVGTSGINMKPHGQHLQPACWQTHRAQEDQ